MILNFVLPFTPEIWEIMKQILIWFILIVTGSLFIWSIAQLISILGQGAEWDEDDEWDQNFLKELNDKFKNKN